MNFLDVKKRSTKPRENGITHVLDAGLGVEEAKDLLSVCGRYVDIVKFGWGTGYVTDKLEEKIEIYREHDIDVYFGGTLFEVSVLQDRLDGFTRCMKNLGVTHIEVSTGVVTMNHERKCALVEELSNDFTVFSEIGLKGSEESISAEEWTERAREELDAGAWKIVTEGRASGGTGIYADGGCVKNEIVENVSQEIGEENLLFEAPRKNQQAWFIERFGSSVNLGNVDMREVIPLETLRLGLRGDTVTTVHGDKA
jgi:phosphosulfolactate synthase